MRLRIWNAFASNNSGSYVIVGRFPSEALAAEVAAELHEVAKAETAWQAEPGTGASPLAAYAARHGLAGVHVDEDEWPHSWGNEPDAPVAWAIGYQVFVHCAYTVSMPRAFGHLMYVRGGRVETELDHSHHPIAAVFDIHVPWHERDGTDVPARMQQIVDRLATDEAVRAALCPHGAAPAWRGHHPGQERAFGASDLVIGIAFRDLDTGFTAISRICTAAGAQLSVRVFESPDSGDPFGYLRPSYPPPSP